MKPYCTQNNGDCSTCSLVSYNRDCRNNPVLADVCTISEASATWDLDSSTLRHAIRDGRFAPHEYRKAGREWLISRAAIVRLYGEPKKPAE